MGLLNMTTLTPEARPATTLTKEGRGGRSVRWSDLTGTTWLDLTIATWETLGLPTSNTPEARPATTLTPEART